MWSNTEQEFLELEAGGPIAEGSQVHLHCTVCTCVDMYIHLHLMSTVSMVRRRVLFLVQCKHFLPCSSSQSVFTGELLQCPFWC